MIDAVRLSNNAEKKNATNPSIQNSLSLLVVLIRSVTTLNPPCISIISTIVIAPIRKKSILDISERISKSCTSVT